ncbi:MoaD/ThiS family protein [Candidatus Woesearchaeota archaeon]|nr:MoaD/ThiS family protein [Candidatus Woesearchaeota archaeon]HIH25432.1 MoaD/ThiS family protein [Nanoarchaeota archaeon]
MKIFIERTNEHKEVKEASTVKELLKILDINPTTVIVARNNELITEDSKLDKNDSIKLISVISGG